MRWFYLLLERHARVIGQNVSHVYTYALEKWYGSDGMVRSRVPRREGENPVPEVDITHQTPERYVPIEFEELHELPVISIHSGSAPEAPEGPTQPCLGNVTSELPQNYFSIMPPHHDEGDLPNQPTLSDNSLSLYEQFLNGGEDLILSLAMRRDFEELANMASDSLN